jgi:TRAP-type C4-dicarboxylate transport system permease small subunit
VILSISVAVLMVTEVAGRYLFTHAFRGLPEIYLLLVMWLYMLGAGLASANRSHLRIGILTQLIKTRRSRRIHRIVITGLTFIITCFFFWWALGLLRWAIERPQTTPILRLPWITSQASIMVAGILVTVYALRDFVVAFKANSDEQPRANGEGS